MFANDEWLGRTREAALDSRRPIIDAHHHIWNRLPKKKDSLPYPVEEFLRDVAEGGHNVVATVYVEAGAPMREGGPVHLQSVAETEFANSLADQYAQRTPALARGIIAGADLRLDTLAESLAAHQAAACGRLCGIRQILSWDEDETIRYHHIDNRSGMASDPHLRRGVQLLGEAGLSFEACIFHPQISELTALARACSGTLIVLNHLGGPLGVGAYRGRADEVFASWSKDIAELATCPNVCVKLGGLNMRINGYAWHERSAPPGSEELARTTERYFLHAIECFGPSRCMFESNYPPDRLSAPYGVLWNTYKRITARFSENEKESMFFGTANRVYRLNI